MGYTGEGGRGGVASRSDTGGTGILVVGGDAGAVRALTAHIEHDHVAVDVVTVACAGDCADVIAVAKGGFPPYSFAWEDGSTNPARHVCPNATTDLRVAVTDKGSSAGEFARAPETVSAKVTAEVLSCPSDAGTGGTGGAGGDSGTRAPGGVCVENPSIEGTPQPVVIGLWDATGWQQCPLLGLYPTFLANDTIKGVLANMPTPRPSDGNTYAVIQVTPPTLVGFGQSLCAPIEAGTARAFTVDAMWGETNGTSTTPAALQVLGGDTPCTGTDVLWTSPPLTGAWVTYCVTVAPATRTTSLTFDAAGNGAVGNLFVDHIVPVTRCP